MKSIFLTFLCWGFCFFSYSQLISNKYDNLSRLIQVTNTNGSVVKYTYDELGNRITKVITTASYAVTTSANPVAGGTVAGSGSFSAGQSCTLTATPNTGYAFSNWTEGGTVVSTNASYSFTVSAARTLVANFVQSTVNYTINTNASPTAGGTTTGGGTYASGASRTVTATPNTGYTFTNWTENGTVVSTTASYTFNLNANRTLVANFALNSYIIAANANPTTGGTVTGAGSYNYGTSCTLTASPKTDYTFTNWTENGIEISTNSMLSFTVTAARSVTANFAATVYSLSLSNSTLSLNAATNSNGTISITSNITWTASSNQTWLTVNPASGSNNGALTLTANSANTASTARTATVTVSGTGVTAQTITVTQLGTIAALSISNNTLSLNAASNSSGAISITSNIAWSASSNQTWLTVSPTSGSNSGTLTLTANSANTTTTARTATVTVSGTGVATQTITVTQQVGILNYTVTTVSNPNIGGTTDGSGSFQNGSTITVIATAYPGYTFINWTENGSIVSNSIIYSFVLNVNKELKANFILNGSSENTILDVDGNIYHSVLIGNQTWMVENLKTTKYNDGSQIQNATNFAWGDLTTKAWWCNYNNDAVNYLKYGKLYNNYAVSTGKLAPNGWHVPTDADWAILIDFLGGESVAGGKLKETGNVNWLTPNIGASNDYGFTALPGGYFSANNSGGASYQLGQLGWWWSAEKNICGMNTNTSSVVRGSSSPIVGYSIRCIKDAPVSLSIINTVASPTAGGAISGGGSAQTGSSKTVTATANTGYTFTNWTENGTVVSTTANYTFTAAGNRTLVANFILKTSIPEVEAYGIKIYAINNNAIIESANGWEVRVIDISGRTVIIKHSTTDKFEIPIPIPGLYLIRLSNKEKTCCEKVIIK